MMTRKELEALGMTDADLEKQVKKVFDVDLNLSGKDSKLKEIVRHNWFREIQKWEEPAQRVRGAPIGSFADTEPDHPKKAEGG